ncbi:MAG: hypothetical protein RJS98_04455 [Rhodospirillaceae bacterium]
MANLEKHDPHGLAAKAKNFEDFILTNYKGVAGRGIQALPIIDQDRKVIVDSIYKYENLTEDFSSICKKLNINAELPHLNSTKNVDYKDHYTLEMFNVVRDHVRLDIEIGGYSDDPSYYGI